MNTYAKALKKYVFFSFLIPCLTLAQVVAKPVMDEVAFEKFLEKVFTDSGETPYNYNERIKGIQEKLDPKQLLSSYSCSMNHELRTKCGDIKPDETIVEYIKNHIDENLTKEKLCASLSADVKWIQRLRQRGKPLQLFIDDTDRVNDPFPKNIGAFPLYLVHYVFRAPFDTNSNMLASDIELKCLKFKN